MSPEKLGLRLLVVGGLIRFWNTADEGEGLKSRGRDMASLLGSGVEKVLSEALKAWLLMSVLAKLGLNVAAGVVGLLVETGVGGALWTGGSGVSVAVSSVASLVLRFRRE